VVFLGRRVEEGLYIKVQELTRPVYIAGVKHFLKNSFFEWIFEEYLLTVQKAVQNLFCKTAVIS